MKNDLHYLRAYLRALEYDFEKKSSTGAVPQPVITISRQRGALGKVIARKTAEILTRQSQGKEPWAVIDRSLAQRVLDDHHLSQHIGRFLTDEQVASIRDRVEAMVGLQPSQ